MTARRPASDADRAIPTRTRSEIDEQARLLRALVEVVRRASGPRLRESVRSAVPGADEAFVELEADAAAWTLARHWFGTLLSRGYTAALADHGIDRRTAAEAAADVARALAGEGARP